VFLRACLVAAQSYALAAEASDTEVERVSYERAALQAHEAAALYREELHLAQERAAGRMRAQALGCFALALESGDVAHHLGI
jgi:hypothetical protein